MFTRALVFAVLLVAGLSAQALAVTVVFVPPNGWQATTLPPPRDDGSKTIHAWQSPDGTQKLFVDVMPWSDSLTAVAEKFRAEAAETIARQQTDQDTHFTIETKQCPDHSLRVKGYAVTFGGISQFLNIEVAVRHGTAVWVTYQNGDVQGNGGLEPAAIMSALRTLCVP